MTKVKPIRWSPEKNLEPICTIVDYRDGVLSGVAEYEGRPHVFIAEQAPTAEGLAVYALFPIGPGFRFPVPADANLWEPTAEMRRLVASLAKEPPSPPLTRARWR